MVDVHCHLNFSAFDHDYDTVITDAYKAGITTIINVGTSIASSKKAVELADRYKNLYAIVGIHPHHADKNEQGWYNSLDSLASEKKVLAIGETGLDYYQYKSNGIVDPVRQKDVFEKQIELAYRHTLPLQIHNRHAGDMILEILSYHKSSLLNLPGMFHCLSGDLSFLKNVLALGFSVGFDGNCTYKGKAPGETTELKDLIAYAPLDRIVIETDSPFLTPIPYRGSRNLPSYAILIAKFISEIKGITLEEIEEQTTRNVKRIFPKILL